MKKHIQVEIHGRYLVKIPDHLSSRTQKLPLLVGFHGYGQGAEEHMEILSSIVGDASWILCSIQALHPFIPPRRPHGACWMTSQDRELRILENLNYVNCVIETVKEEYGASEVLVFHGFSQGVAMACRAAILCNYNATGSIILGGDIPPEFKKSSQISKLGHTLIGRGNRDPLYLKARYESDINRLAICESALSGAEIGAFSYQTVEFEASHDYDEEFRRQAKSFLQSPHFF